MFRLEYFVMFFRQTDLLDVSMLILILCSALHLSMEQSACESGKFPHGCFCFLSLSLSLSFPSVLAERIERALLRANQYDCDLTHCT